MEHRCTERIINEVKILIYKHDLAVAIGRIKNGSRNGVFVETDLVDIECEHQLKLEVLVNKNTTTKMHCIEMEAIVIHQTSKGFGAEIDFQSPAQADLFIEILCGTQVGMPDEHVFAMVANS